MREAVAAGAASREALLLASFREFRRRGETLVRLGVDSENPTGAVRLYERAGMQAGLARGRLPEAPVTGRTPTLDDAEAIAAFLRRVADAEGGGWTTVVEIRDWLTRPDLQPEDFRIFERDGDVVGYADVYFAGEIDRAWLDVRTLPEAGIEDEALAWGEDRIRGRERSVARAPASAGSALCRVLERHGYRTIRHSFQMQIELDHEPPPPEWPAEVVVRELEPGEERAAYDASVEAFADHWEPTPEPFEAWMHDWTGHGDDCILLVAADGGEIAGVCLCAVNERAGGRPTGWIGRLAVLPPRRRRGVGEALLRHSLRALRLRGRCRSPASAPTP